MSSEIFRLITINMMNFAGKKERYTRVAIKEEILHWKVGLETITFWTVGSIVIENNMLHTFYKQSNVCSTKNELPTQHPNNYISIHSEFKVHKIWRTQLKTFVNLIMSQLSKHSFIKIGMEVQRAFYYSHSLAIRHSCKSDSRTQIIYKS